MGRLLAGIGTVLLGGVLAAHAGASTVKEQNYVYGMGDSVRAMPRDVFAVCDGCQTDKLHKLPKPFVAIRVAAPSEIRVSAPDKEFKRSETPPAESGAGKKESASGVLGTVSFRFGSAEISVVEKKRLDEIVAGLPAGAELSVTGYTCSIGTKTYNMGLSERRAKAVAKYLRTKKAAVKHVEAKGECCPVSTDKKLNRRVKIEKEGGK